MITTFSIRSRKRPAHLVAAAVVGWLLLGTTGTAAQQEAATMRGVVRNGDDGQPVPDAMVYLADQSRQTRTDPRGEFVLTGLEPGSYTLIIQKIGLRPRGFRFTLTENHMGPIDLGAIEVEPQVAALEDIVVEEAGGGGRLQGYFHRMRTRHGDFITRADIERLKPRRSTDLLRTVAGVDLECRGSDCRVGFTRQQRPPGHSFLGERQGVDAATDLGGTDVQIGRNTDNVAQDGAAFLGAVSGNNPAICAVRYFLDGVPYESSRGINDISPQLIEGIEIYKGPATTPVAFARWGAPCGVIAIWTRKP